MKGDTISREEFNRIKDGLLKEEKSMIMNDKYLWILGGGAMQVASIEEVHKLGLKTIISDMNDKCVCKSLADQFVHLDIFDIDGHLGVLRTMQGDGFYIQSKKTTFDVQGVFCAGIDCPETAAAIQEYLGKPTAPREIARICHNKVEFRKVSRMLGWPTPKYQIVVENDPDWWSNNIGFPCIVKNTDNAGSRGNTIFIEEPSPAYYRKAISLAQRNSKSGCAIVEELWQGTEHTVETLFDVNGKFWPCFITDRYFDYSQRYALETGLRHPSTLPSYIQRKAYQIAEQLGRDLGVAHGPFKLDIMVTEDGVRVLEATTRFSGGFDCQYLVPAATGKNILKAGILTCMGYNVYVPPVICKNPLPLIGGLPLESRWNKVALSESLWPPPGRITSIEGIEEAGKMPGVVKIIMRKNVGDIVAPYIDCGARVVFIVVVGDTEEEAQIIMKKVKDTIRIVTE